ncbi:MAG: branched-chain amino acid ABC transporter substrate-binding protein, partial [Burkholderiales bacterium]
AYGKGLAAETKKAMGEAGKQPAMEESITAGEKDYSALVSKLKQANIDVIYFGGYHTEAGLIIRQMRDQGMNTILMGGDALITQEFWSITGDAGEGTLMTFSPDPRKNPAAADLVKRFKDKGIEPEGYVLYTYAALQAWKQAAEKAKSFEVDAVRKAVYGQEFAAPGGKIKMDEANHHTYKPVLIGEILKDGQFKVVSRSKGLVKAEPWSQYTSPDKGCDWIKHQGTYQKKA